MDTDDLIRTLSGAVTPVTHNSVERRVAFGMVAGAALTLAAIVGVLGFRHDLAHAMLGFTFWMKATYTIALGVGAIVATLHLSRPDTTRAQGLWLLLIPFLLLAGIAAIELARTPVDGWLALWQGRSWTKCAILILILSLPIYTGLIWAFRQFAPTRLRLTGAVAGLAASASAATLYGLHCPEASATFVLTWYTLGMALMAGIGAIFGPRLLRW